MVRPPAAPVTLPKLELVMVVFGLLQRTKLNGLVASARTTARRRSLMGIRLASERDSLFPEKPRTQSRTRAVLPSAKVEGVAKAAEFRERSRAGSKPRGAVTLYGSAP